ncbi:hypothetical protein SAMN05443377_10387 [Propionibacterium cyclohexanicum]|uniref:Yip1 domain-containing protein n=1 Tax=Propionibacterium cyclohexanicum TaxID=64702 RepID=A0A1H9QG10_9ACTN|nr:hypothetical protein [Propionibacterium cyclohexanicum]SER59340.1 hypothetical protein SAMN05443377_10387 [Propionibacterium cyclohexanicum]
MKGPITWPKPRLPHVPTVTPHQAIEMNSSINTTTTETPAMELDTEQAPRLTRMRKVYVAILALFLAALTIAATGSTLEEKSLRLGTDSPFASPQVQLTVLRVASGAWAVLFSLLQAFVLAVLLAAIARVRRPGLGLSWFWVLVGQLPFLVTVAVIQLTAGTQGMTTLTNVSLRVGFGVVSILIYSGLARAALRVQPVRLALFVGVAVALNTALLLIAR